MMFGSPLKEHIDEEALHGTTDRVRPASGRVGHAAGLVVNEKTIANNFAAEFPFMATENLLMAAVQAGGDRQALHEVIRGHSQAAAQRVKSEGLPNDLLDRLRDDPKFRGRGVDLDAVLDPTSFVGRAPEQVDAFIAEVVKPIRQRYADHLMHAPSLSV